MVNAQEWLDKNYPKEERNNITELNIISQNLEGKLNLEGFINLEILECNKNKLSGLDVSMCPKLKILDCGYNLLSELDINNNKELIVIACWFNKLTELNIKMCSDLKVIVCNANALTSLDLSNNLQLEWLDIADNNFSKQNLSFLSHLVNLEVLTVSNSDEKSGIYNKFVGGLEHLANMSKLELYSINGTEVDSNSELLPNNAKMFKCYGRNRTDLQTSTSSSLSGISGVSFDAAYWILKDLSGATKLTNKAKEKYKLIREKVMEKAKPHTEARELLAKEFQEKNDLIKRLENEQIYIRQENEELEKKVRELEIKNDFLSKKLKEHEETNKKNLTVSSSNEKLSENNGDSLTLNIDLNQRQIQISEKVIMVSNLPPLNKENIEENYDIRKPEYSIILPNEFSREIDKGKHLAKEELPIKLYHVKSDKLDEEMEKVKDNVVDLRKKDAMDDSCSNYATLSYVWGKPGENYRGGLTPWGKKSLKKAIEACNYLGINYLWMDQLCINQSNKWEKNQEVPKMKKYYGNATVTLVAINSDYGNKTSVDLKEVLKKIMGSQWFARSWTFQEGWLSKWTIFMFDDVLVDGRALAATWVSEQPSWLNIGFRKSDTDKKIATPIGWVYYKNGYDSRDTISLTLSQALREVKGRSRSIPIDGIYSILGLLPYGNKVQVNYNLRPQEALFYVMEVAMENKYGEPLAWHGTGKGWMPMIDNVDGSTSVEGGIDIRYVLDKRIFNPDSSIEINGLEYDVSHGDIVSGSGSNYERKIWIKNESNESKEIIVSGTREVLEKVDERKVGNDIRLLLPNKDEWKSDKDFGLLVIRKGNVRHRLGLLVISKGSEKLSWTGNKKITVESELETQTIEPQFQEKWTQTEELQTQIEQPPK